MANTRFECPEGVLEHGRRLWDLYCEHFPDLDTLDTFMLEQACRLADISPTLAASINAGKLNATVSLGIVTDKLLALSKSLGMTKADRMKLKLEPTPAEKAKKAAEAEAEESKTPRGRPKRSSLDDLKRSNFAEPVSVQ